MPTSNVPQIQFTPAGLVLPQESDVMAGVQADMDAAFGGGLNPALETPQGQLASSQAAIIADKNSSFAYFCNQVDPQFASGRFQDAIARIYYLTRDPARPTVVNATVTGLTGTVIPAGTFAQDTSGNTYSLTASVTIGSTGAAPAQFQNIVTGPIACPAGTLTQVYQTVPGWDSITNAADGILGQNVESRADFEFRRQNSVFANGHGTPQAIYAAVFAAANVLDVYVIDNPTNAAVNTGATNYSVAANSIYVAVVGGVAADIAKAIWSKKDVGCSYNGNTSVTVVDDSGYSYPQPSYTVQFEIPSALPIKFAVSIVDNPALPSNIVDLIRAAIVAQFSGLSGTARERIGSTVFASRYYGPVALVDPNVSIISILVGTSTATLNDVPVGIDREPSISTANIAVTLV